jgi:hypothetical protein
MRRIVVYGFAAEETAQALLINKGHHFRYTAFTLLLFSACST